MTWQLSAAVSGVCDVGTGTSAGDMTAVSGVDDVMVTIGVSVVGTG